MDKQKNQTLNHLYYREQNSKYGTTNVRPLRILEIKLHNNNKYNPSRSKEKVVTKMTFKPTPYSKCPNHIFLEFLCASFDNEYRRFMCPTIIKDVNSLVLFV